MNIHKILLYPFAAVYNLGTRFRNHLYDMGHKPSFEFTTTVISVGNLNVGGSGKTPMVEYLIRLLKERHAVATLSRGYRRESSGYRHACELDNARSIGDEPMQLYRKFGKDIHVFVSEDRVFAIPNILQDVPDTKVILLDDALQHRRIRPHLTILVTDFYRPFYTDFLMPLGRLREGRSGAARADVVVVTKCAGGLSQEKKSEMTDRIRRYAGNKPVFFSEIQYVDPVPIGLERKLEKKIILVTGIARTESIVGFVQSRFELIRHFRFGDHHHYTKQELDSILKYWREQPEPVSVLTTEKDMVRLLNPEYHPFLESLPCFYLPIRQSFLEDGSKFDELILQAVGKTDGTQ